MKKRDFVIPFVGLKHAVHHFEFELDESFFETADETYVKNPDIKVDLTFDKTHEPYVLDFKITGTFEGDCDRCAANIKIPVDSSFRIFLEFGNTENDDETEVIYLSREAHDIDLYEHIHDFAFLSIPMVKRCETEADLALCDERVDSFLKKINTPTEDNIDPRWASLKKLKK